MMRSLLKRCCLCCARLSRSNSTHSAVRPVSAATVSASRPFSSSQRVRLGQPCHATHPHIIAADEVTPKISKDEYASRRSRLFDRLIQQDKDRRHVVIIPSHDRSYMAAGIPFIYRQHSNMRYLSGFLENESVLVLEGDKSGFSSTLFVKEHSNYENLWEGRRSGLAGSKTLTGVDNSDNIKNLQLHLLSTAKGHDVTVWYNRASLVSPSLHEKYIRPIVEKANPAYVRNIDSEMDELRVIKSNSELELMRVCGDITSEMFMESIAFSKRMPDEHALFAKLDYECRIRGATNLAYLPVVAGGENALTIHYIKNHSPIRAGDMVLVDAGCDLHGYVSDVTRTWPVSGEFSEPQRQLYEAVEEIHRDCLLFCKPGEYSLDDIFAVMLALLAKQLLRLGVVSESLSDTQLSQMVYQICPHHVGHWLGMDVHDTPSISRTRKLAPNMVICIEPGLYFHSNDERIHKEFRGSGIRIEDNIVITEDGYENLNSALPTSADDVEALMHDPDVE